MVVVILSPLESYVHDFIPPAASQLRFTVQRGTLNLIVLPVDSSV